MPDIMVLCPTVGAVVPTGVTTEVVKFESILDVAIPFRCPACLKTHKWRPIMAWVAKGRPRNRMRLVVQGGD
jgi:hypothetical protein